MLEVASFILILESSLSSTFFLSLLFLAYLLILTLNLLHRGVEK
jgi:NADH-quinone oxidoreductase subunit I